ncbi:MAG: hypothetical protein MJ106_01575 [Lentisphaeria bacterium]|nr:hypothetical protein [Lentisphaeria bacterium]
MGTATHCFAISVMFHDQVGIVAEISSAVKKIGGNLLDVSQTVLRGYFSMILLGEYPENITEKHIRNVLESITTLQGAQFGVLPFMPDDLHDAPRQDDTYILTASGPDQPGLVATLSQYLKERGINIVDLASRIHNGEYTMVWQIQIPNTLDVPKLQKSMQLALQPTLTIGLRHQALFQATNEI